MKTEYNHFEPMTFWEKKKVQNSSGGEHQTPLADRCDGPQESPPKRISSVWLDWLPISRNSHEEVIAEIALGIEARKIGQYVSVTSSDAMYWGQCDEARGSYIRNAAISVCDGIGVVIAGLGWGYFLKRFPGPALQLACTRAGEPRGWRHFYYGGKGNVVEEMTKRLKQQHPGMIVCGSYQPPFRELTSEEDEEIVELINKCKPDIVWVGLGFPKQERWIANHLGRIRAPWMIGVGAAFDFHSGTVRRAPLLLRKFGLEWAYRWALEPRQRAQRYYVSAIFVMRTFFKGVLGKRSFKDRSA